MTRPRMQASSSRWKTPGIWRNYTDSRIVEGLVSDSFVYTDYDGTVMNKAQFLADLKDPDYRASLITNEEAKVILYPNAAVISNKRRIRSGRRTWPAGTA